MGLNILQSGIAQFHVTKVRRKKNAFTKLLFFTGLGEQLQKRRQPLRYRPLFIISHIVHYCFRNLDVKRVLPSRTVSTYVPGAIEPSRFTGIMFMVLPSTFRACDCSMRP